MTTDAGDGTAGHGTARDLRGFLVAHDPAMVPVTRGWPAPVTVGASQVWFHGHLHGPATAGNGVGAAVAVARAWQDGATAAADRLRGEFGAVVVGPDGVAVLGDRLGLRPVYLRADRTRIVVSTDLAALVRETDPGTLDDQHLADLLGTGVHLGHRTPWTRIRRLVHGQHATWTDGRLRLSDRWAPDTRPRRSDDGAERSGLRRDLLAAVDAASAGARVAVELSGGLDSTAVAAAAARHGTVPSVSLRFPASPGTDEGDWIDVATAALDLDPHPIDGSVAGFFAAAPEDLPFLPAPTMAAFTWAQEQAELAETRAAGASVLLTGEGGDAVLLGGVNPFHLADLLLEGRPATFGREVRRWAGDAEPPRPWSFWAWRAGVDAARRWRRGEPVDLHAREPLARRAPWLAPDFAGDLALDRRAGSPIRAGRVWAQVVLDGVLRAAEAVRTHHGLLAGGDVFRHPLLDLALVDRALTTPWSVGTDPRIDRVVQRWALAGLVPDATLRRRSKATFDHPLLTALAASPAWLARLRDGGELVALGAVEPSAWRAAVDGVTVGIVPGVAHLRAALAVEAFLAQRHRIGPPALLLEPQDHQTRRR